MDDSGWKPIKLVDNMDWGSHPHMYNGIPFVKKSQNGDTHPFYEVFVCFCRKNCDITPTWEKLPYFPVF